MPVFYIRNDDVNVLDRELVEITGICAEEGVPLTHTVEPGNVTDECLQWLLEQKNRDPRLLELMQHGYDHSWHDEGEFGGQRSFADQFTDLEKGKKILLEKLGKDFFPALNFPFGPYNSHSMRAADQLGFKIICSHYNCRLSRRLLYAAGHLLGRGKIMDKHVSYHLDFYPGTGLYCIDMAVSLIKRYHGEHGGIECDFFSLEEIMSRIASFNEHTPVIGVLLHHRYHHHPESLDLVRQVIRSLKSIPEAEFLNMEEIYQRHCPQPVAGFRPC